MFANVCTSTAEPCELQSGRKHIDQSRNLAAYKKSFSKNNLIVGKSANDFRQAFLRMTVAPFLWVFTADVQTADPMSLHFYVSC